MSSYKTEMISVINEHSFSDWVFSLLENRNVELSSSALLETFVSLMSHSTAESESIDDWKKPAEQSREYCMIVQSIEKSRTVQFLELFNSRMPASDRRVLIQLSLASLLPLDNALQSLVNSLPSELQFLYQEMSIKHHRRVEYEQSPSIPEFDALTIVASLFSSLLQSVKQYPGDPLFSHVFICMEALLTNLFEIRSTRTS